MRRRNKSSRKVLNRRHTLFITGTVRAHFKGSGSLVPDPGQKISENVFLPQSEMRQILHADRVVVRILPGKDRSRAMGAVVKCLERTVDSLAGRLEQRQRDWYLLPYGRYFCAPIYVENAQKHALSTGDYAVVSLSDWSNKKPIVSGKLVQVLQNETEAVGDLFLITQSHGLPSAWPEGVQEFLQALPTELSPQDLQGRKDLRDKPFITIDGEEAKDFDDAVYCEKIEQNQWRLYVAIADVAHYVKPDTPLDSEAQLRAHSMYFPRTVIPMLPEKLSNKLCSLRPLESRLVLVCEMIIDASGKVRSSTFYEGVICSKARLTYDAVLACLQALQAGGKPAEPIEIQCSLTALFNLTHALLQRKKARGAMELTIPEGEVKLNTKGEIVNIIPVVRHIAHRMIEEAMLLANVAVVDFLEKKEIPHTIVYRVHEEPKEEKLENLQALLAQFDLSLGNDALVSQQYSAFLEAVSEREDKFFWHTALLRSLPLARYDVEKSGHFGLGYDQYCHFTSPIRRYPDLLVHRAVKHALTCHKDKLFAYSQEDLSKLSAYCSEKERDIERVTREYISLLKCRKLESCVGSIVTGVLVEIHTAGIFIEISGYYITGLAPAYRVRRQGSYVFDEDMLSLTHKKTGTVYKPGTKVLVRILSVEVYSQRVDLLLVDPRQ